MTEVPRSLKYIYFQNKSFHYDNLKKIKPCINDRPSPGVFKRSMNAEGFSMNCKERNSERKRRESENTRMADRLLNIMNSPRREVQVQGYSKYHCVKRNFLSVKKEEVERKRNIELANEEISDRICNAKPSVGSLKQWGQHYSKFIEESRRIRRHREGSLGRSELEIHGPFVPTSFKSILGREDLEEIRDNNKLVVNSSRLYQLPDLNRIRYKRNSSGMNLLHQTHEVVPNEE